jgi:hypothetical protein
LQLTGEDRRGVHPVTADTKEVEEEKEKGRRRRNVAAGVFRLFYETRTKHWGEGGSQVNFSKEFNLSQQFYHHKRVVKHN